MHVTETEREKLCEINAVIGDAERGEKHLQGVSFHEKGCLN